MKILFITGTLKAGGVEKYITMASKNISNRYKDIKINIYCCISAEGIFAADLMDTDITVSGPKKTSNNRFDYGSLIQVLSKLKPDIIHSMIHSSELIQVYYYKRYSNAKIFFSQRNTTPLSGHARIRKIIQYWLIKPFISSYTANGYATQNFLCSSVYEKKENIPIAKNLIESYLSKIKVPSDIINIVYTARFHPIKNQKRFIQALLCLDKNILNKIKVIFIGSGKLLGECKQLVSTNNLDDTVEFRGMVSNLDKVLKKSDIGILLSKSEGSSNALLEYISYGLAVLSSDQGDAPYIFNNESISIIKENVDNQGIADILSRVIMDSSLLVNMKKDSLEIAKEYHIDKGTDRLLRIFGYYSE